MSHLYDLSLITKAGGVLFLKDDAVKIGFPDGPFKTGFVELNVIDYSLETFIVCTATMIGCTEVERSLLASWRV